MPTDLKEFDDLIAALQDERPQIDPGFARELDTRAAAGFAKPRRRFRLPRPSVLMGAPALAFTVIIALVVAASQLGGGSGLDPSTAAVSSDGGAVSGAAPDDSASEIFESVPQARQGPRARGLGAPCRTRNRAVGRPRPPAGAKRRPDARGSGARHLHRG